MKETGFAELGTKLWDGMKQDKQRGLRSSKRFLNRLIYRFLLVKQYLGDGTFF